MLLYYDLIAVIGVLLAAYELHLVFYARRDLKRRWYFERLEVMKKNGVNKELIDKKVSELITASKGVALFILVNTAHWMFLVLSLFSPMLLISICVMIQSWAFSRIVRQFKKVKEIDIPEMVCLNMTDHLVTGVLLMTGVFRILQGRWS